ncbi:DNA polymerase I, partial [Acinetobacter baumannii]
LLGDASILKIGQNIKYDALVLKRHGIEIVSLDDTMLMSYVLDAGRQGHGMDDLSKTWLGHEPIPIKSLLGSGKSQITFDQVPIDKASAYAA